MSTPFYKSIFKSSNILRKFLGVTSWYQSTNLRELGILRNVPDSNLRLLNSYFKNISLKYFSLKLLKTSSGRSRGVPVSQA